MRVMTHPYIQIPVPVRACASTLTDPNMRTGMSITSYGNLRILVPTYINFRVWSRKVSKGVMREQEFLVSHPCKMQDSPKKWSPKSCKKYHCKTMQDLAPAKSTRTKGGGATTLKMGGRASLLGSRHFLQDQNPFSLGIDITCLCTYGLAFLTRPGLQDKTQVL
jgi:hypothetical protein